MEMKRMQARLNGIEACRGIAACLVVLYHAARHVEKNTGALPFGTTTQFGHAGVDFFFVLSGFIILFVHGDDIGQPQRAGHYIARRATRLFPLYWVMLAVVLGTAFLSKGWFPDLSTLLRDLLLLPFGSPTINVAWTLQFEILFYLMFLILILHRRLGLLIFSAWVACVVAELASPGCFTGTPLAIPAAAYSLQFFMGMAAAHVVRKGSLNRPGLFLALGALGFLGAGALENLGTMDGYAPPARFIYGATAMLLLIGVATLEQAGRLRIPAPLVMIGSASYAIYLMHLLGLGLAWKLLDRLGLLRHLPETASFLLISAAGISAGLLGFRLLERPLIRIVRQLLASTRFQRRPARGSAPAA